MNRMPDRAAAAVIAGQNSAGRRLLRSHLLGYASDAVLLFLLTAVLIWPVFKVKYSDRWWSIESTFIADARFLRDHWPHPGWQPLWYTGTRFDYVYPPALRYGSAALSRWLPIVPARGYHIYVALNYCIGIVGVYLLVRMASRSRGAAWLAAAAVALVSPSFLFLPEIRADSGGVPQRLGVLVRYGEGPHMSALAWVSIALAFSWRAVERWRPLHLAAAGVASALVVLHNFYGATALAMLFPVLVWSLFITYGDARAWARAAAIVALAYGLTAFWLVPSYYAITLRNMQYVSAPGSKRSLAIAIAVCLVFLVLSHRYGRNRPDRAYAVFLSGAFVLFTVNVLGNQYFGFRVIGEPGRLIPELDLVLILVSVELLRRLWNLQRRPVMARALAAVLIVVGLGFSHRYIREAWRIYPADLWYEKRVEYTLPKWMAEHMPGSRAVALGSIRFWYTAWDDVAHLGGGSEQGMLSDVSFYPLWEIPLGDDGRLSKLWMQILGVDAIIVNGKKSEEHYHDYQYPEKFKSVLPVLHDNGKDDVIYAVPRRYPSLARVVDTARLQALQPINTTGTLPELTRYYEVIENGPEAPTRTQWEGTDVLHVSARVSAPGQSILIQVAYDTPWRAWSHGSEYAVRRAPLGFMRIDAPPGEHNLRLVFTTPVENIVGRVITLLTLATILWLVIAGLRSREVRH